MQKPWDKGPPGAKAWGLINASAAPKVAEVHIYDEIGIWGVSAQAFASEIKELDAETLQVYVNSPGGDAYDGIAIMNALRRHSARVEITVDGLAASAASIICMAGDRVVMNRGAEIMVHETWSMAMGSSAELRKAADQLDKLSTSYADAYAARAGGTRDEWREAMRAETWYSAEEAVEAKLADEWVDAEPEEQVAARAAAFDLSQFKYRGRAAAARAARNELPATEPGHEKEGDEMALRDDLIERLGLDAEATDEDILTAVEEAVEDDEENESDGGDGGDGGSGDAPAAKLPKGVQAIDSTVLAQLQADARAGREAAEEQAKQRREAAVKQALADGKISAASSKKWLARMEKDEVGTAELLGTLAKNAVPVEEIGLSDEPLSAEDALYAKVYGQKEEA